MRFKYTPPISNWAPGKRRTVQQAMRWGVQREPYPQTAHSLSDLRYDRQVWRLGRKPRRLAVGFIRAFGATHFFNGCYPGAEND